jgi:hypothetical protein
MSRESEILASEQMRERAAGLLREQAARRAGLRNGKDRLLLAMERLVRALPGAPADHTQAMPVKPAKEAA